MKKMLSITMILLVTLSMFSIFAPQVEAQEIVWNTNPTPLPTTLSDHGSVVYNDRIYVLGGITGPEDSSVANVYFAETNPDGTIDSWVATESLPEPRGYLTASVVTWSNFLYVVGGHKSGPSPGERNNVWYAQINPDGTLGSWITTTPMPWPSRNHMTVVWNGRIYIGGGTDGYGWRDKVAYAEINPDGSLGSWTYTTSLPLAYGHMGVLVHNGIIYLIGGSSTWGGPGLSHSEVYYASINPDGSVGSWNPTTPLPDRRHWFGAVLMDENIYVIGGSKDPEGTVHDTVWRAEINDDGTVGSWIELQSIPKAITMHTSAVCKGRIYVKGGMAKVNDSWIRKDTIYSSSPSVAPDFEISVSPDSQMIIQGGSVSYTVTLRSLNGFSSPVSLALDGLPLGASSEFDPPSVVPDGASTLTVTTASSTPFGTYVLNVIGTGDGVTHLVSVLLLVKAVFFAPYSGGTHGGSSDTTYRFANARYYSDHNLFDGSGTTRMLAQAWMGGGAKAMAYFRLFSGGECGSSGTYRIDASFTIDGFMRIMRVSLPAKFGYVFGQAILKASLVVYDVTQGKEVKKAEIDIFNEKLGMFPIPSPVYQRTEYYNQEGRYIEVFTYLEEGHEYHWSFEVQMEGTIGTSGFVVAWAQGNIDTKLISVSISPMMIV